MSASEDAELAALQAELDALEAQGVTAAPDLGSNRSTALSSNSSQSLGAVLQALGALAAPFTFCANCGFLAQSPASACPGCSLPVKAHRAPGPLPSLAAPPATVTTASRTPSGSTLNPALQAEMAKNAELKRQVESLNAAGPATSTEQIVDARNKVLNRVKEKYLGIEICFLVDFTGSMKKTIRNTRLKIREIVQHAKTLNQQAEVKIAFVGYRDHSDGEAKRIVKVDFLPEGQLARFESALDENAADGGGDVPEDVSGGLQAATTLSWFAGARVLIHIGDAPAHGVYNTRGGDDYPKGCSCGPCEDSLAKLAKLNVDYYFGRLNSSTDHMVKLFKQAYGTKTFKVIKMSEDVKVFLPSVINSITVSVLASQSRIRIPKGY